MRFWVLFVFASLFTTSISKAEVHVSEYQRMRVFSEKHIVEPGNVVAKTLTLSRGDILEVYGQLSEDSTPDISLFICPDSEYRRYLQGSDPKNCKGYWRESNGGEVLFEAPYNGAYTAFVDNTFSMFSEKAVTIEGWVTLKLPDDQRRKMQAELQPAYEAIESGFEFTPFNINLSPCGQANAFSEGATGHITVCSELIMDAVSSPDPDVISGIFLHELGHTLLNLWGLPNYQNEQTVDEFATVIMIISDAELAAEKYLSFFAGRDPMLEANYAQGNHSPHPLSVQRMRNIGHIIDNPDEYVGRWIPILYRNMSQAALLEEMSSISEWSDAALAEEIYKEKFGTLP